MKLINMNCPKCGGALGLPENTKQAQCPFCNTSFMIDDEVTHIQFDNTKQAGYDFEKGRIEAQQDHAIQQEAQRQAAIRAQQEEERKKKNLIWWILGWIFIFPVPLTILIARSKTLKPAIKAVLIVAVWGTVLIFGAVNSKNSKTQSSNGVVETTWASKVTPLDSFDYYVDGESIVLTDYVGRENKVNIPTKYEVDGKELSVTALEGTFALESVKSAIIPEGVTSMSDNVFNSCGLEYVYLPSTLSGFDGWNYFHDGEILYYGGTEDQWDELFTGERKDLDFKRMYFESKIDDLLAEDAAKE